MPAPRNELHRRAIAGTARFLTFSTYRRLRLFDNERIKAAFAEALERATTTHAADVIAWVLMPEHVHVIVYFDAEDRATAFLRTLTRLIAGRVLDRWRELHAAILPRVTAATGEQKFWQPGGGFDRHVVGDDLVEKIRYIHRNAIVRGLAHASVDWPWSSARAYEGRADAVVPPIALHRVSARHEKLA